MSEVKQNSAVVVGHRKRRPLPRWLIPTVLVLVVFVVAALIYQHHREDVKKAQTARLDARTICTVTDSAALLKEASAHLSPLAYTQLQPIVQQIQKLKTYQQDPNCLYVVTTYYLDIGDVQHASQSFNELKQAYNPSQGYSKYLGDIPMGVSALQSQLTFVEQNAKLASKNSGSFGNP
jgi:hypothetical protein